MYTLQFSVGLIVLLGLKGSVYSQGVSPATVESPKVESEIGKEATLSCFSSVSDRLRFCVWERTQKDDSKNPLIVNFNEITSQPGLYSGMSGYSYSGEGFRTGECGVKINSAKQEDFAKWQCTLIADDMIYRGYVELEKKELPKSSEDRNQSAIASSRTAVDDKNDNQELNSDRPRPIITSYNDARSIVQPELIVHSADGAQLIQEVKVESAGLQIKPKRGGKLIVFE